MSDTLLSPPAAEPVQTPDDSVAAAVPDPIITTPDDRDWSQAVNPDGTFDTKAHEYGIPEHWKSVGGIVESYKDLQRMKGHPGAEATPEQISTFREAYGIPEVANAESYGVELPEELKEAYSLDSLNEVVKAANESAHLGHSAMIKAVIGKFGEIEVAGRGQAALETAEQQATKLAENAKALEADPNFAGERRTAALQTTANGLNASLAALGESQDSVEAKDIARNPLMLRVIHHFASKTTQDSTNLGSSVSDLRSSEEQANDIIENPANALYDAYHDGDKIVGKKVLALMGA